MRLVHRTVRVETKKGMKEGKPALLVIGTPPKRGINYRICSLKKIKIYSPRNHVLVI